MAMNLRNLLTIALVLRLSAAARAECRFPLAKRLTEALRARRPDFVVMTEWVIDGLMADFSYFHGCGNGFYPFLPAPQEKNFPELFLYTFPEIIATQRNPNPMSIRNVTNQACLYLPRPSTSPGCTDSWMTCDRDFRTSCRRTARPAGGASTSK